jgi:hypothetical protein
MDETRFDGTPADNLVFGTFALLGALCAVVVGIAIFDPDSLKRAPSRSPASEPPTQTELRMDLPVLD